MYKIETEEDLYKIVMGKGQGRRSQGMASQTAELKDTGRLLEGKFCKGR